MPQISYLYQQQSGRRHENNLVSIVRPVEGDHNKDACPEESTLRDWPCWESLDAEPVPRSARFEDGEISIKQEEATPASYNIEHGWSISSKMAVTYATMTTKNYGTVQHQRILRSRTAVNTTENKLFDPGGKQVFCALSSRPIPLSGRACTCVKGCTAMFAGMGVFSRRVVP